MKPQKKPANRLSSSIWRLNIILTASSVVVAVAVIMLLDDTNVLPGVFLSVSVRILVGAAIILVTTLTSYALINRLCASLRSLSAGTQEIEKGNYKVQIENKDPRSEVGMLISNFNHMARELDNTEMFRKDFINNFSHEFKTPITSIAGFAARLQSGGLSEEKKQEYIEIIVKESRRLSALSSNILLLSHYENQDAVTRKEEYSLDEQLRLCVLARQEAWGEKSLELVAELEPLCICADADMLAQVWNNLIDNAVKFTPAGGRLTVRCYPEAGRAVVVVADTGVGMTEETLRHLFDKFYQGDPSHKLNGNGLGLALVKRIVELCGGEILVTSRPNIGSQFRISLPGLIPSALSHNERFPEV